MADNNPMTSEGDRAGVYTPSPRAKARSCIGAAVGRLQFVLSNWDTLPDATFKSEVAGARESIFRADQLLNKSEETVS